MNRALTAVVRRTAAHRILLGATALAALVELVPGVPMPLLTCAGMWLLLGAPTALWYGFADRVVSTCDGRALIAVGLAVTTDMTVALLLNTVLPPLGDGHPLARAPLALGSALTVLVIAWATQPAARQGRSDREPFTGLVTVSILGGVSVTLAVAGAIRLNNGLGSAVGVVALAAMAVLIVQLLRRRESYPEAVLGLGLFFVAAALLLLTSLRGWYITGHDIQREYEVFQLAASADRWDILAFKDPYNACLSITLLPTAVTRLTGIDGLYVFKAVFPLLFALTPPMIYRSVCNVAPRLVGLLSAAYFMAFPTFFTDMTFLARQEIAFLILGGAIVVLTDSGRPLRHRRIVFTVMLGGVVLSHYSTTYVLVVVLGVALLTDLAWRLLERGRRRGRPLVHGPGFVTWWTVAAVAAATVLWTGPLTQTGYQLRRTVTVTIQDLIDPRHAQSGSSDTSYSLLGGTAITPQQRLSQYQHDTLKLTATDRANGHYLPLRAVEKYPVQAVSEPGLPLTGLGRALHGHGVDIGAVNRLMRQSAASLLQVLLLLGLAVCLWSRRRSFQPARDQVTLTVGMLFVIGLLTVLPQLSVDYGVLRAFQQGLFFYGPFIVAGSLWAFRWARRWTVPLASTLAVIFFLDLTGAIPQVIGGYPPQLNLNNAGQYYDIYYVHPQERSAINWVETRATEDQRQHVQSEVQTDRYTFSRLQTLIRGRASNDIFPTLISSDSYVFLGSTTVRKDETTTFYRGDLVTYRYPRGLLDSLKNQVYSSDGAEIFR
jgi:uncharacterized membrane protein